MIGQRLESPGGSAVGPVLMIILAGLFVLLAVFLRSPHPAIFALMPAAIGVAWLMVREKRFAADITAKGLEIEDPPLSLSFADIDSMRIVGKARQARAPIYVWHADGVLRIPARLNLHSGDLYEFLSDQLPVSGSRDLPPVLAMFCADQEGHYGADRVFTCRELQFRDTYRFQAMMAIFGAITLVGPCWSAAGLLVLFLLRENGVPWLIGGLFALFVGGLITFSSWRRARWLLNRKLRKAGLVISPGGLAMTQGNMTGQLRWDELRNIRYRSKPGVTVIHLVVAGASIMILDIYDRPLAAIHEQLQAYWRGDDRYA